jgi:hypothetical protein
VDITHQPQEIRQYVRRLPEEEQPDFAAVLESIGQRSSCRICHLLQDPPNGTRSSAGLFSPAPSPDRELKVRRHDLAGQRPPQWDPFR